MDEEGWFSVTPEQIAVRHAVRCGGGVVIDAFTGVGGNAIQFATTCHHVISIDIDPKKVALAFENAKIYGVEDYIEFIGNIVFLSPPWGGPAYRAKESFTLDLLKPKDGYSLFQVAQSIAPNVIMYLPRNVDLLQVEELSWLSTPPLKVEIEENMLHGRLKSITAYFGDIAFSDPLHV
ncbi:unnamed protein product [Withania somnifera]